MLEQDPDNLKRGSNVRFLELFIVSLATGSRQKMPTHTELLYNGVRYEEISIQKEEGFH